jgi:hypothetical protein
MRFTIPGLRRPDRPAEDNARTRPTDVMAANPGARD